MTTFVELTKAFDPVNHDILQLQNLEVYDISEAPSRLIPVAQKLGAPCDGQRHVI